MFADFKRDHAAAIRGNPNTAITAHSTAFKRLTITEMQKPDEDPIKWARVFGSAIGLMQNGLLWLQVRCRPLQLQLLSVRHPTSCSMYTCRVLRALGTATAGDPE